MSKFFKLPLAICTAAVLAFAPAISNAAIVLVWEFTSDHCDGGCLTGQPNGGTVTVTDNGTGTLSFNIQLANGNQFINAGFDASFGFNLAGIGSVTYSLITPGANYTIPGGNPQTAGALHMDGTGFFDFGLDGIGNGGSDPLGSSLTFTIAATDLDITDIVKNATGNFFAADIISGTTGFTGGIDASNQPHEETPEPGSLLLLGIGIAALGLVRRRKMSAGT